MHIQMKATEQQFPVGLFAVQLGSSLFIYLFNRFHHDYNTKIDWEKNTFEQDTRTRDEGGGHTTERGSKLSVALRKIHKY